MKTCTKCGEAKEQSLFGKRKQCAGGLDTYCKACRCAYRQGYRRIHGYSVWNGQQDASRKWYLANTALSAARSKNRRESQLGLFRALNADSKRRAAEMLTDAYIRRFLRKQLPALGRLDIPSSLIEGKRAQLRIHRLLKEISQ